MGSLLTETDLRKKQSDSDFIKSLPSQLMMIWGIGEEKTSRDVAHLHHCYVTAFSNIGLHF